VDTDVLIVGAGPTGLMLANQLARRGVRATIIDRHAGPARETRALGVQARTMEIYAQLGVVERALELGKKGTGANVWANGRWAARLPLGEIGRAATPYSYLFILGQDDNERILGERLRALGSDVQWNSELTALAQHADHVVATLKQSDGSAREIRCEWVAGCDGARSSVRELNEIGFPGAPYEHVFYVADVEATGTMVADEVNVYLAKEGFLLFFPMRGTDHWRIVGILPAALAGREGERRGVTFEDVLPAVRGAAGPALEFRKSSWFSTYRIHHRAAVRFRQGRCFLLGDAAHIHSPVGAQGMNTGLQDAYNLGWKLALVLHGKADARLLDTYEAERIPIARRLLETTDRGFQLAVSDRPLARLVRTHVAARVAAFALGLEGVQRFAFRTISQTGINYREGPLAQTAGSWPSYAPQAGDRFPWLQLKFEAGGAVEDSFRKLDDLRFHLLVFGQHAAGKHDFFQLHLIPDDPHNAEELDRADIPATSYFLLRPDGHIALCGARLEASVLQRYLKDKIGSTA
jgi:2-polyprenyl-6-methoxyphenol hydroxylase-like FAD-dependent oxidoreductase